DEGSGGGAIHGNTCGGHRGRARLNGEGDHCPVGYWLTGRVLYHGLYDVLCGSICGCRILGHGEVALGLVGRLRHEVDGDIVICRVGLVVEIEAICLRLYLDGPYYGAGEGGGDDTVYGIARYGHRRSARLNAEGDHCPIGNEVSVDILYY